MKAHWKYLKYVLRHKWFVFLECLKLGVPLWIAITHDWDKFMPDEWFAFVDYFQRERTDEVIEAWDQAVNLHYKRNRHHWQFYVFTPPTPRPKFGVTSHDDGMSHAFISRYGGGDIALVYDDSMPSLKPDWDGLKLLKRDFRMAPILKKMHDVYALEMLADWRAMARASGGTAKAWYLSNREMIFLHPETQAWIEMQLGVGELIIPVVEISA